ncbi:hypothetical protein [Bosea sp. UC22_33]|uniref:hypothetical protein n=1 Tax=Bosea sp. UC22_33 TaxID=3350165 RepID=UPI00366E67CC
MNEAPRQMLADIAQRLEDGLSDVDRGFVYLTETDASFLSQAMGAFLSGESPSLDGAFGLTRQRGRPKSGPQNERNMALVKAALQSAAKTWDEVAADPLVVKLAGKDGIDTDVLRKLVNRHRDEAEREIISDLAKKIAARLEKRDAKK